MSADSTGASFNCRASFLGPFGGLLCGFGQSRAVLGFRNELKLFFGSLQNPSILPYFAQPDGLCDIYTARISLPTR